ncbi:MAG: 16S rRNA (cytosine(1402)-N(4))-methyltransferase RsmH [Saprospirales bacterium]|nr:16S rRNA (cytosine(1402)-N(4))-methyltransferase RsmH [Saprospirales bacterium]MBK8920170.1 16S rRNA (cytosine(1402)-N(4))-methyltransferase RsmH [Saprospirales bacterium]
MYHAPVLRSESLAALQLRPDGVYVDATFGGGGHSAPILTQLGDNGRLYAFDQDEDARTNALKPEFTAHTGFHFIHSNFRFLKRQLRASGVRPGTVDGILADLGVSSHQLDTPERGFSYRFDAALDMRMNPSDERSAADVLNACTSDELQRVFGAFGEVRNARTLAQACVRFREKSRFQTTADLVGVCEAVVMGERWRYLSQVFQALRMEVNDEIGALRDFMADATEMLRQGGRLVVITYHSIEDRLVKNWLKSGNAEGAVHQDFYGNIERPFEIITKKPLEPSAGEVQENPRARSAKLRVAVKK